jgi:hypothetical protein
MLSNIAVAGKRSFRSYERSYPGRRRTGWNFQQVGPGDSIRKAAEGIKTG